MAARSAPGLAATEALAEIGVSSLGYQLGYAVRLAAISFSAAWLPLLYRLAETPHAKTVLREATTVVIPGFSAMAAVIATLVPDTAVAAGGALASWVLTARVSIVPAVVHLAVAVGVVAVLAIVARAPLGRLRAAQAMAERADLGGAL